MVNEALVTGGLQSENPFYSQAWNIEVQRHSEIRRKNNFREIGEVLEPVVRLYKKDSRGNPSGDSLRSSLAGERQSIENHIARILIYAVKNSSGTYFEQLSMMEGLGIVEEGILTIDLSGQSHCLSSTTCLGGEMDKVCIGAAMKRFIKSNYVVQDEIRGKNELGERPNLADVSRLIAFDVDSVYLDNEDLGDDLYQSITDFLFEPEKRQRYLELRESCRDPKFAEGLASGDKIFMDVYLSLEYCFDQIVRDHVSNKTRKLNRFECLSAYNKCRRGEETSRTRDCQLSMELRRLKEAHNVDMNNEEYERFRKAVWDLYG